ncbi:Uncharacterised protein [Mycobacteroides abscessus subsp. abscessus]|nr:Uncharacterised protein [Mycobacteroides abscessus subsp. abscessus]
MIPKITPKIPRIRIIHQISLPYCTNGFCVTISSLRSKRVSLTDSTAFQTGQYRQIVWLS